MDHAPAYPVSFIVKSPTLYLSEGLSLLVAPLREFVIAALFRREGAGWWLRCVEVQSEPVRECYDSEPKVRAGADPSFWIKTAEFFWDECRTAQMGVAERGALSSLRHYRNMLCHDTSRLSQSEVYHALQAIRLLVRAISPVQTQAVDAIILAYRVQHPAACL